MKKKLIPKERVIYDNYDLSSLYEEAKEILAEMSDSEQVPDSNEIWDMTYELDKEQFDEEFERLKDFFATGTYILFGSIGRWDGTHDGGFVFKSFERAFYKATVDCSLIRIFDENGHFIIRCSHHDGTCRYEIKKLTDKGIKYLENWQYSFDDPRSEASVHRTLVDRYSTLPRYAEKEYGAKRTEYIPMSDS